MAQIPEYGFLSPGQLGSLPWNSSQALSYGDPMGGSYPDPDISNLQYETAEEEDEEEDETEYDILPPDPIVESIEGVKRKGKGKAKAVTFAETEEEDVGDEDDEDDEAESRLLAQLNNLSEDDDDFVLDDSEALAATGAEAADFPSSGSEVGTGGRSHKRKRGRRAPHVPADDEEAEEDLDQSIYAPRPPRRRKFNEYFGTRMSRRQRREKNRNVEQTIEYKQLNIQMTGAWLKEDYEVALTTALKLVKLDPSAFELHATIAEIYSKKGKYQESVDAIFTGAHSDTSTDSWWFAANRLKELADKVDDVVGKRLYCFSRILSTAPGDVEARTQRMHAYLEKGSRGRARADALTLLGYNPLDLEPLEVLADIAVTSEQAKAALKPWKTFVGLCLDDDDAAHSQVTLELMRTYINLYALAGQAAEGIKQMKRIARFLVGRDDEMFWDRWTSDDREFDDEDQPRRLSVPQFVQGQYAAESYGPTLPIQDRVKLGMLRISLGPNHYDEGMHHLEYLGPDDDPDEEMLEEYRDLFMEAGETLREAGHHSAALRFYEPLRQIPDSIDSSFWFDLALCYQALGRLDDVREAIQGISNRDRNPRARVKQAQLYQSQGRIDLMWKIISALRRNHHIELVRQAGLPTVRPAELGPYVQFVPKTSGEPNGKAARPSKPIRATGDPTLRRRMLETKATAQAQSRAIKDRAVNAQIRKQRQQQCKPDMLSAEDRIEEQVVQAIYGVMQTQEGAFEQQDTEVIAEWMQLAAQLYEIFKAQPLFFSDRPQPVDAGVVISKRGIHLFDPVFDERTGQEIPTAYRRIKLTDWVGIIERYALQLAEEGDKEMCIDVLETGVRANIIYNEFTALRGFKCVALRCAIIMGDEQRVAEGLRWFPKHYPYSSEMYKLINYATCALPHASAVFISGPEMKNCMRQIKAMDFALLTPAQRAHYRWNATDPTRTATSGVSGIKYTLGTVSAPVLTQYAHQNLCSSSPNVALNYYFRAYVLRPNDPVLNFLIGLCYLALGIKRQAANRHYQIQQGMVFVQRYVELRTEQGSAAGRQEAELNRALIWTALGLFHLAVPAFQRCLEMGKEVRAEGMVGKATDDDVPMEHTEHNEGRPAKSSNSVMNDFTPEAALACSGLLAVSGDRITAKRMVRQYLVL